MSAIAVVLAASITLPTVLGDVTIRVPKDQPSIQQAVDAAGDGDTVLISKGTYNEAVVIDNKMNLTIKGKGKVVIDGNGVLRPITVTDSSGITIEKIRTEDTVDHGMLIKDSDNVTIKGCRCTGGRNGVRLESNDRVHVEKVKVEVVSSDGIDMDDSGNTLPPNTNCTIVKCKIDRAMDESIELNGTGHMVVNNKATNSGEDGIFVDDTSSNITIQKNKIIVTGRQGISLQGTDIDVLDNTIKNPMEDGVFVEEDGNNIDGNKIKNPGEDGVDLHSNDNTVSNNKVTKAARMGFEVGNPSDRGIAMRNTFDGNSAVKSVEHGFRVNDGANTFRNNKGKKNGGFDLFDDSGVGANVYEDSNKFGTQQIQ